MRVSKNERGATVVLVATVLLLLFGFAALAIDAGLGYNDRRGTTNAADNAALAAAWENCNPSGVGEATAAATTAAANGYDDTSPDTEVVTQDMGDGQWQVTITQVNDAVFGGATPYAGDSLTVVSEAVALCDPTSFLEGMAIFAGGDTCGPSELNMTGASITVNGGIHSNGDLQIHGTPATEHLTGPITYRDGGTHGTQVSGPPMPYPLDVDISEYRPGGTRATNGSPYFPHTGKINNAWLEDEGHIDPVSGLLTQSGIYYSSFSSNGQAAIDLHALSAAPGVRATFVAEGFIEITGGTFDNFRGYDPIVPGGTVGMLFYSEHPGSDSCNTTAIKISSATLTNAAGVIYAPHGVISLSNAAADLEGSIIGWRLAIQGGQDLVVTYQPDPAFQPKYQVELIR